MVLINQLTLVGVGGTHDMPFFVAGFPSHLWLPLGIKKKDFHRCSIHIQYMFHQMSKWYSWYFMVFSDPFHDFHVPFHQSGQIIIIHKPDFSGYFGLVTLTIISGFGRTICGVFCASATSCSEAQHLQNPQWRCPMACLVGWKQMVTLVDRGWKISFL